MLQRVLAEPVWTARMMPADIRAVTSLVWATSAPGAPSISIWSNGSTWTS